MPEDACHGIAYQHIGVQKNLRFTIAAVVTLMALLFGTAVSAGATPSTPAHSQASSVPIQALPGFQQGTVPVDGGTVHYVRGGSGPALVLLHGWPETWWAWHKVMPGLATEHTVIALDLPGLGSSSFLSGGYDAASTARRVRQAVHELGFDRVVILAHDLGVLIAYDYARDFPAEVTRLAVLDSSLNGFGLEDVYVVSFHFLLNESPAPIPEHIINNQLAVRAYLGYIFNVEHVPGAVDRAVYYRAYADPAHREAGYDYFRAYPQNAADNLANAAKRLTMPVLAMGGEFGFGTAVAESFQQVANDVHEVVAPGSGHFIPEEAPGFLVDCASLFFGDSQGQTPPPGLAGCAP